jgi:hypothetical protein
MMAPRELMRDFVHNLRTARWWIAAQWIGFPLIALAFIGWTRLPDGHWWQVVLSLLLPLVLLTAALILKAGTVRRMLNESQPRAHLAWGALSLLIWMILAWFLWALLDRWDDRIFLWASYLNSKAPASWRGHIFTYQHLYLWLTRIEWFLRWVVLPALFIPFGAASAVRAWRIRWFSTLRVVYNWRWFIAVIFFALLGVALPTHFFAGTPHGTLHAQIWAVVLKLIGAYLLAFFSWILLLAWVCVLLKQTEVPNPTPSKKASEPEQ